MKHTLLALALVAAAGAAGAQTATTPSAGSGAVTTPSATPPTVSTPAVPSRSMGAGGATVTTSPVSGGAVQAPSAGSAGATTPGMPSQSVTPPSQANLPAQPNAQGSANAVRKIEADGYKNVQGMTRNPDGSWSGKAMRGSAMVDVHVDARGNVVTR